MRGLYVHIPFCIKKCNYCDFNSVRISKEEKESFIESLIREFELYSEELRGVTFDTLFIGGGTPTILEGQEIRLIMEKIRENFDISKGAEITIESNPKTIDEKKAIILKEIGINRISMGIQAVQQKHLDFLGRVHSFEEAKKNVLMLQDIGFENINVDLMFAFPGQTMEDWKESIGEILKLNLSHISGYSLIIEDGTAIGRLYDEGKVDEFDEELDRKMYYYMRDELEKKGYHQYEISNFAKDGRESKHNTIYWKCFEYAGFGPGSHSFLKGVRYSNVEDLNDYKEMTSSGQKPVEDSNQLSKEDMMEERIFMGLRMNEGISISKFNQDFGVDFKVLYGDEIEGLVSDGLLEIAGDRVKLTEKGIDISNSVFTEFLRD